ncbi:MAG: branched-chain amino acid ABC transporter permease [Lachnospiraceae bacterium]|nr:branched-chain amino acid ABC transporter permease [Lachnospiraceae bacterium]
MWNQNKRTICNLLLVAALILTLVLIELLAPSTSMWFSVLRKVCTFALAAVSMNLLNGFTGLFSLGQAGFMLLGAYTYAILTIPVDMRSNVFRNYGDSLIRFQMPLVPALLLAGLIAAFFAFLIGLPVLRLKSDYLAIATLGFAEIVRGLVQLQNFGPVTNGPDPINMFTAPKNILVYAAISGISILIIVLIINSTYGRAFKAIRDDEIAAEAMGINLAHHKRLSFIISSFFCGIAGAMMAMCNTSVSSVSFTSAMTYQILLVVVIGGIGSISGSIIAAFIFYASSEWWLKFLDLETYTDAGAKIPLLGPGFRMVVFSILIMIIVLFFRQGIMGTREISVYDGILRIKNLFMKKSVKGGVKDE